MKTKALLGLAVIGMALASSQSANAGVHFGVSIGLPFPPLPLPGIYAPAPQVVYAPAPPVYAPAPQVVYAPAPPVYCAPAPVVVAQPVFVGRPYYGYGYGYPGYYRGGYGGYGGNWGHHGYGGHYRH